MRIGQLIPWVIALGFALDATTRLIPIDAFSFRAWEALTVAHGPTGPFEPDRIYANPMSYGDLSRSARYRHLRQPHLEYFSTDQWGFRNTVPRFEEQAVRWLLVGDSFGVSSGVRDGNSLASQVARWSGERVYNASSYDPLPLKDIRFTSERLGMKEGHVIYEFMERAEMPSVAAFATARMFTSGPPAPKRNWWARVWNETAAVSRLRILSGWEWEAIMTRARPNQGAFRPQDPNIASYELVNGQTMLFFVKDVDDAVDRNRQISTDYLVWLKSELAKVNLDLVVLLVPNKYSVYGPLVKDPRAVPPSGLPLQHLAESLAARDVFAVNVSDTLRKQAASLLPQNEYLYFIDDTHWNERGISVVAQTLVDASKAR